MATSRHEGSFTVIDIDSEHQFKLSTEVFKRLKAHQKCALSWLLAQHVNERGSLLADEMGLGKTVTAIALLIAIRSSESADEAGAILIVCPKTIIFQWSAELVKWNTLAGGVLGETRILDAKTKNKRALIRKHDGILLTSYEQVRDNVTEFMKASFY